MSMKRRFVLLIVSTFLAASLKTPAAKAGADTIPGETTVAGYSVEKTGHTLLRDERTGYYLIRTVECDGAHIHLALCADLRSHADRGFSEADIRPGRLRHLQTGRGIRIGDTPARVRGILGRPTWQGVSKHTPGETVWTYHHLKGTQQNGVKYVTLFRFRKGRVSGVELSRDLLPGC